MANSAQSIRGLGVALGVLIAASPAAAQQFSVLYAFTGPRNGDGAYPLGGVVTDSKGAVYGATQSGGKHGVGALFKFTPPAAGETQWTEEILHSFGSDARDGQTPEAGVVMDANGALYGTTAFGGGLGSQLCGSGGCGTVYRLDPPKTGQTQWSETILHRFAARGGEGALPAAGVILDGAGNVYGTTQDFGGVFRLKPPTSPDGAWTFTLLHAFRGGNEDGATPFGSLTLDGAGALYGTTYEGGAFNVGVVFRLTPPSGEDSPWNETILHSFSGSVTGVSNDGAYPIGGVTFDAKGALYGTTFNGGLDGQGAVFKLTPNADRTSWHETLAYSFTGVDGDGSDPAAAVTIDPHGAIYGMTQFGGFPNPNNAGTIFVLKPGEETLHKFRVKTDGAEPYAALFEDASGALFGTTQFNGASNAGTVFRFTP
jgi:uncharacterized repeat protein (TIGR03803 family)